MPSFSRTLLVSIHAHHDLDVGETALQSTDQSPQDPLGAAGSMGVARAQDGGDELSTLPVVDHQRVVDAVVVETVEER